MDVPAGALDVVGITQSKGKNKYINLKKKRKYSYSILILWENVYRTMKSPSKYFNLSHETFIPTTLKMENAKKVNLTKYFIINYDWQWRNQSLWNCHYKYFVFGDIQLKPHVATMFLSCIMFTLLVSYWDFLNILKVLDIHMIWFN